MLGVWKVGGVGGCRGQRIHVTISFIGTGHDIKMS